MSSRNEYIKELKKIFNQAKNAPRIEDGSFKDFYLGSELFGALIVVGKEKLSELKEEVYPYVKDINPEYRAEAIRTLGWGTRLLDPDFKPYVHNIWLHDPDEDVKIAALVAWYHYNRYSENPKILLELYYILISQDYSIEIKTCVLDGMFEVAGAYENTREAYEVMELADYPTHEAFNNAVNWDRVHAIMRQYVPGWKEKK